MVQVEVSEGWLEGEKLKVVTDDVYYYSFKGIPYAEPPVGKLRFKVCTKFLLHNYLLNDFVNPTIHLVKFLII